MAVAEERNQETTPVSAFVPVEMRERLGRLAAAHERSLSGELRAALRGHFEAHRAELEEGGLVLRGKA